MIAFKKFHLGLLYYLKYKENKNKNHTKNREGRNRVNTRVASYIYLSIEQARVAVYVQVIGGWRQMMSKWGSVAVRTAKISRVEGLGLYSTSHVSLPALFPG